MFNFLKKDRGPTLQEIKSDIDGLKAQLQEKTFTLPWDVQNGERIYWGTGNNDKPFGSHYILQRGIYLLAENAASLPLIPYSGENELDPAKELRPGFNLRYPHPSMTLNELLTQAYVYYFYRGEFMIEIREEPIFHLAPINPKLMSRNNDNSWKYYDPNGTRNIQGENLIYFQMFNPDASLVGTNRDRGLSPVDIVKNELLADRNAAELAIAFFKNFNSIGGYFYDAEGKATVEQMEYIVQQADEKHQGTANSYQSMGLPRGIKYQEANTTLRELQFLESRKDIQERLLILLGIHKSLVGITDQVNRSVSEEASRNLWRQTLKPTIIRSQEKFNQVLMRHHFPGIEAYFNFDGVEELKETAQTRIELAEKYRALGYTQNEVNKHFDLGMDEVKDGGNQRYVPVSLVPIEAVMLEPEPAPSKNINMESVNKAIDDYFIENKSKVSRAYKYRMKYEKARRYHEKEFTRMIRKHFVKQHIDIMKVLNSQKNLKAKEISLEELMALIKTALEKNTKDLSANALKEYEEASKAADGAALSALNQDIAAATANTPVVNRMTKKITAIRGGVMSRTYKLIEKQLEEGYKAGESIDQMAKRLQKVGQFNVSRSRTIARTETQVVMGQTTNERFKEAGVKKKQWLIADEEARKSHRDINGDIVGFDDEFANGLKFPGDSSGDESAAEVINCRCVLIPIVEE